MLLQNALSWRIIAPLSLALAALAGLAPTPVHRSDNFNNNVLASFWGGGTIGNAAINETNSRLECRNTGPTGNYSSAGVGFEPYGINWKQDFHVEFNYRFKINSASGSRKVFFGAVFAIDGDVPATFTGLAAGLYRDSNGLFLGVLQYENGSIVDTDVVPITQVSGKIEIDWDKSMDRMTVERSGSGASAHLDGYYAANGGAFGNTAMEMGMGVITVGGNVTFTGANCYIDNWEADFVKRNFTVSP